jgi:hypothetical protein
MPSTKKRNSTALPEQRQRAFEVEHLDRCRDMAVAILSQFPRQACRGLLQRS